MIIYFLIYFFIFLIIFSFFSSFLFNAKIIFFLQKNKKKIIGKIKNSEILQKDYNYYLINKKNFNLFKNKNFIKKFIWNKLIKEKLLSKEINLGIEIPKNINKNIINKKYKKYYKNKFLNIYYKIIKEKELLNKENFDIIKYGLFNNKHIIENYNYFYEKNNYVNFDYISLSFDKEKKFFLQNWFLPKKKKRKINIIRIINYYSKEDEEKIKNYLYFLIPFFKKNFFFKKKIYNIEKFIKNKEENLLSNLYSDYYTINNISKKKKNVKKGLIIGPNKYKNFFFLIKINKLLLIPKNVKIKQIFFKKKLKYKAKKIFFKIKNNKHKFENYYYYNDNKKEKKFNEKNIIFYKLLKKKIGDIFFLKSLKGYSIIKLIDKSKKYNNFVKISTIFKKIIPSTKTLHKVQKKIFNYDINKILKKYHNQNVCIEIKNDKLPILPFKNEKKYKKKIENYIFSKKIKIGDKKILLFNNKNENKEIILLYLKNIKIYNNKKIINQWNRKLYEIKNFYKKKVIQSNNDIIKLSKILNKKIKILNKNKNLKCNDELTAISFGIPIKKLSNPIKYKNNFIILKINKRYNKNIKNINKINKKIKLYFSKKEFLNFLIKKNIKNIIFFKN